MKVAYGIDVKDSDDPHITRAEHCLNGLSEAGVPGTFLVDFIPALKYIPSWFPGASFKRKALMWRRFNKEVPEVPFKYVEEQLVCKFHHRRNNTLLTHSRNRVKLYLVSPQL